MLDLIRHVLEQERFQCAWHKKENESDKHALQLLVCLGYDERDREQTLRITAHEQYPLSNKKLYPTCNYYLIELNFIFPFDLGEETISELSSFLHFLNHTVDMPGFEMNEVENKILYRYVWMTSDIQSDPISILSLVSNVMLNVDHFAEILEQLSEGTLTLLDLYEEIDSQHSC